MAAAPDVIGVVYFDNDVTGVHYVNGVAVRTNWKFDTSTASATAFRSGVSNGVYGAGVYPPYLLGQ